VNRISRFSHMSLIAWAAFAIATAIVAFSFAHSRDYRFLYFAIPMLAALVIIPMILTKMSQHAYSDATPVYERKAKLRKISTISSSKLGEVVKIRGTIVGISFRWLNRPHLKIDDSTGVISAVLFTQAQEKLVIGEQVEILGTLMRGLIHRGTVIISAISVRKLEI